MAIQYRGTGTSGNAASNTTLTTTLPTGWAAGDLLFLVVRLGSSAVTGFSQTGGTGTWTIDFSGTNGTANVFYAFCRRLMASGDTAPTFSWTTSTSSCWSCGGFFSDAGGTLALDGYAASDPLIVTTPATTATPNAVTGAGGTEASMILTCNRGSAASSATSHTYTPPSGWTWNDGDNSFVAGGLNPRFAANAYQLGVSGTVTPGAETLTDSASDSFYWFAAHALVSETVLPAGMPQRYGWLAPPSRVPWIQKDRRDANLVATAANPLVSPLDTAWQAGARYSHLYGDTAARDRRAYFYQRPYVSNPSLLTTALLENELLGGADTARHYTPAVTHPPRWWMPQQPARLADPLLIGTALLESPLLRPELAPWARPGSWPAQRPLVSDPNLLAPAVTVTDPTLSAWLPLWLAYNTPATHVDRRESPAPRPVLSVPDDIQMVGTGALGAWWGEDHTAAFTYGNPRRLADPLLIGTALLENELLGSADDLARHRAWYTDRREVPQQRQYYLPYVPFQLENELLGGAETAKHAWWWRPGSWPQQRACISDPSFYPPQNNLDPLLTGQDLLDGHQCQAATHYDRREVPQQRLYISDPSFYPTTAPTDPLTLAWGAGGNYWHLYNRAADITDRREVPQQRAYVSDPLLLTTALLETPFLGGGDSGRHATWYTDRREYPAQRSPVSLPDIPFDPVLGAFADLARRYGLPFTHADRRLYPQQRLYFPVPPPPPALVNAASVPAVTARDTSTVTVSDPRDGIHAAAARDTSAASVGTGGSGSSYGATYTRTYGAVSGDSKPKVTDPATSTPAVSDG